NGATKPDVKEVRQRRVADVVVVRRIGADEKIGESVNAHRRINLVSLPNDFGPGIKNFHTVGDILAACTPSSYGTTQRICLCIIPDHRQSLAAVEVHHFLVRWTPATKPIVEIRATIQSKPKKGRNSLSVCPGISR